MKPDRRTILRIFWILGAFVFIFLLARIGPGRIWSNIARLTPIGFMLLFALRTLYWFFRTFIWRTILAGDTPPPGFGHLFVALMAGHAVSYLTPSAYLGGEAVRTVLVRGADRKRVFASVVVDTTFEILSLALFTAGGVAFIAAGSALPVPTRFGLVVFMVGVIVGLFFLIRRQRRGMFIWLIDLLGRIRIRPRFVERNRDKIGEVDARIADFYGKGFRTVGRVFALNLMLHGYWVAEIHLTLAYLGAPDLTLSKSFLAVTLGAVGLLLPTTPASLGTYEAANLAVFAGLGWSAGLSLSLSLVRRVLSLFWAGIGLLFIAWRGRTKSSC